jgi:hypothetical protein
VSLWKIACAGGNYNICSSWIDVRNGNAKTARVLTFPTQLRKAPIHVLVNPVWWDARNEIWAFHRNRSFGDCGHCRALSLGRARLRAHRRAAQGGLRRQVRRTLDQMAPQGRSCVAKSLAGSVAR